MTPSPTPKSEPLVSHRHLSLAGLAAFVGCAACCTVPLLAASGLGGGAAAALSAVLRPGAELIVGAGVFFGALGVLAIRSRLRRRDVRSGTPGGRPLRRARSGDGGHERSSEPSSCGCSSACAPSGDQPIACTLAGPEPQRQRATEFQEVFVSLTHIERGEGSARWHFRDEPGLELRLRELVRRERECCRFFEFHISRQDGGLVWETRAPEAAAAVLTEFMRLPETLRRGRTRQDLTHVMQAAGLTFPEDAEPSQR